MIGWQARIGIIYPEDGLLDDDFLRPVPRGVSIHITRLAMPRSENQHLRITEMSDCKNLEVAASLFSLTSISAVAYACTSGSFSSGSKHNQELIATMEKAAKAPATTTSTASIEAFRAMGVYKVAVAAPYKEATCERLHQWLTSNGIEVVHMECLGLSGMQIPEQDINQVYEFVKRANTKDAQAIFVSCTNFRAFEIVTALENDLRKTVVTANQATIWYAMQLAGVSEAQNGMGSLFTYKRSLINN